MIFGAVNCAAHVEIVETENNGIRAHPLYIGAGVGDPVLQAAIEQIELRADIANELAGPPQS